MAKFRKVSPRIWNDRKFRALSSEGKLVFLMVLTHPNTSSLGTLRAYPAGLAHELDWSAAKFRRAFAEICAAGMVRFAAEGLVWMPNFLKYNAPESPNVVKSWVGAMADCPECALKSEVLRTLSRCIAMQGEGFRKAFAGAFAEEFPGERGRPLSADRLGEDAATAEDLAEPFAKGLPNQEQEHEQEPELEQDTDTSASRPGDAACERAGANVSAERQAASPGELPGCSKAAKACGVKADLREEDFRVWYAAYPRRVDRKAAQAVWQRLAKAGTLPSLDVLLAALAWQRKLDDWTRENGRYVPHPATYLSREKWTDEPPAETARPQASYCSRAAANAAGLALGRKRMQELRRRNGVAEALRAEREGEEDAVDTTAREAARDGGDAAENAQGGGHDC
ncbi:MAG: hypothetical protein Q4F72_10765 [Desulfovibrionaceae bacterium]|nr:hypothetical protein [Desulfovibrionaceae bacterium]